MRITKISVKGLFGMFDHEIPLNQEERITIIHGPNGVGKTVVLRLIQDLFDLGFTLLHDIPYDQLRIDFFSGGSLVLQRTSVQREDRDEAEEDTRLDSAFGRVAAVARGLTDGPPARVLAHFEDASGTKHPSFKLPYAYVYKIPDALEHYPEIDLDLVGAWTAGRGYWKDTDSEDFYTVDELFKKYPQLFTYYHGEDADWFRAIKVNTNTRLIRTQRSWPDDKGLGPLMYSVYMGDDADYTKQEALMTDEFGFTWLAYRAKASFGNLEEKRQNALDSLATFDDSVDEFSQSLKALSLFDIEDVDDLANADAEVLAMRKRLLEMLSSINTQDYNFVRRRLVFEEMVNERFLFKTVKLDPQQGIKIVSSIGDDIQLVELSSGEQHLLILYYQLLFEIESDAIVMIDEPEISLNVVWQRNFVKDLQRIIELRNFDVLIATHSAEVIYDKWDWTVALGEKARD